jgi:uncharacterized membrane protein AbrB (regulator of aidB expression)
MSGIITLVLLAFLCAVGLRWLSRRLRLPAPTFVAVFVVFMLVVLALWGRTLD